MKCFLMGFVSFGYGFQCILARDAMHIIMLISTNHVLISTLFHPQGARRFVFGETRAGDPM